VDREKQRQLWDETYATINASLHSVIPKEFFYHKTDKNICNKQKFIYKNKNKKLIKKQKIMKNQSVLDAFCPHCKSSFLSKGKIFNHFRRSNGQVGIVSESMVPGKYEATIQTEYRGELKLEEKETVTFFCQFCEKDLTFSHNNNIFEMKIELEDEIEKPSVFRSALYGEKFTAVVAHNNIHYFGMMSEERQEEIKKAINLAKEHISCSTTLEP